MTHPDLCTCKIYNIEHHHHDVYTSVTLMTQPQQKLGEATLPSQERISNFTELEAHEPAARAQHTICFWQHLARPHDQQCWATLSTSARSAAGH